MKRLVISCMSFLMAPMLIAAAQEPAKAKRDTAITGRAVAADGQPVAGAVVMAAAASGAMALPQTAVCDDEGNFKLTGLNPGAYRLFARMPGYVALSNGMGRERHRPGEHVTITMVKGGAITGRVLDEFGEPMVGVPIQATRTRNEDGSAERGASGLNVAGNAGETDDRGVYRIYGLEPGHYVVSANNIPLSIEGMLRPRREMAIYHPSAPRSGAAEVAVRGGDETAGIDIRHRVLRSHAISGTLSGEVEGGGVFSGIAVMLTNAVSRQAAGMAMALGERKFTINGVEDGEYDLAAARMGEGMDFALSPPRRIRVSGADLSGIDLKLAPLGAVSGRVAIEPAAANACKIAEEVSIEEILLDAIRDEKTPGQFEVLASQETALTGASLATPDKSGAFTAKNLEPGRIRLVADLPSEHWYVRAITRSASPQPIDLGLSGISLKSGEKLTGVEVRIAEGAASLSGKVVPANDAVKMPNRIQLHLIPAEADAAGNLLRYAETIAGRDGSFGFKHLAPGKYWLLARPAAENADRPLAWDAADRAKLRREAEAAKNEIDLKACDRVNDRVFRFAR